MEIDEVIKKILNLKDFYQHIGKVTEVDTEKRTCTVEMRNEDSDLQDVRFQAMIAENTGVVFIPEINSDVIVGYLDEDEAYIIKTSKVANVEIKTSAGIVLNGDEFGGLIKIEELTNKINGIVADFNSFVTTYM